MRIALVVCVVALLVACGESVGVDGHEGSPPDQWGHWALWAPARGVDIAEEEVGDMAWDHVRAAISSANGSITGDQEAALRPSLTLLLHVAGDGSSGITEMDVLMVCESVVRFEQVVFDPASEIRADGTVEFDLGFVTWGGRFDGSERFSGSWSAGDCEGSWSASGEGREDGGWFTPEKEISPMFLVEDWGVELTTVGRHPDVSYDLCVEVSFDQPAPDLDSWLESYFEWVVTLDCESSDSALLSIDVTGEAHGARYDPGGFLYTGATVRGLATLSHPDQAPLVAEFGGTREPPTSVSLPRSGDPEDAPFRDTLQCALAPVFFDWWGTGTFDPTEAVEPFPVAKRCENADL